MLGRFITTNQRSETCGVRASVPFVHERVCQMRRIIRFYVKEMSIFMASLPLLLRHCGRLWGLKAVVMGTNKNCSPLDRQRAVGGAMDLTQVLEATASPGEQMWGILRLATY